MFAAPLPSEVRAHGAAGIGFASRDGATRLAGLYQRDPLRVLFPHPAAGDITSAVLVTTSGGLTGGDRLDIRVGAGSGSAGMVLGQAAEKLYRSAGGDTVIDVVLSIDDDAWLEWLPQETILFDGARLRRKTRINLAPGARLMAAEFLVFGRRAYGETLSTGLIRDGWEVYRDGKLAWADALHLEGDLAEVLDHPACFDGARACATLVWSGEEQTELARELLDETGVRCAATSVNGLTIVRWLGPDAAALRWSFGNFWAAFRAAVAGLPGRLPRLWEV